MTLARTTLAILVGAVLSATVILACGDDSPVEVDAQVDAQTGCTDCECDCPAAEPPLDGRIVVVENVSSAPGTAETMGAIASCDSDAILLGGACTSTDNNARRLRLYLAGNPPESTRNHACAWENPMGLNIQGDMIARAICLEPAP